MTTYTVEVYKRDARTKKGERRVFKQDYEVSNLSEFEHTVKATWPVHRVSIQETYVTVINHVTRQPVRERYDEPYQCSVASEHYHCS